MLRRVHPRHGSGVRSGKQQYEGVFVTMQSGEQIGRDRLLMIQPCQLGVPMIS